MVFTAPYAGLQSIRVGSAHLNKVRANLWKTATDCLTALLRRACELEIDIIGVDLNQGASKFAAHGISPLRHAFNELRSNHDGPQDLLGPGTQDDCVGFLIVPGSELWRLCTMTKVSCFSLFNDDIGRRHNDDGMRRPVVAHFRIPGKENRRQRKPETELARKQRSTNVRRGRKGATRVATIAEGGSVRREREGLVLERIDEGDSDVESLEDEF